MKAQIFSLLMEVIFRVLNPERVEMFADKLLDLAEDFAKETENPWAKKAIEGACSTARAAFNIEDND